MSPPSSPPVDPRVPLHRTPGLEVEPLADGRLLLRTPRGSLALAGVAAAQLERLLGLVDGRRTLADLQTALADEFATRGVADVVAVLVARGALRTDGGGGRAEPAAAPEPAAEPPDPAAAEAWERAPSPVVRPGFRAASANAGEAGGATAAGRRLSVGIVGGGTAGWLAALALRRRRPEVEVTLIESSAVPVIGVGEATTPLLPQLLHADLGLDAGDLFRHVRPTLKLGVRFDWGRPAAEPGGAFNYPFGPLRLLEPAAWDGGVEAASLRSLLMTAGRVPAFVPPAGPPGAPPELRFGTAVAYHLDNRPFVAWLRRQAAAAGVEPVDATVADVRLDTSGERVDELVAEDGRRFRCDLWLDCSGFRSLLMGNALGSPFDSFAASLFTDRALVAAAPLDPDAAALPPYTHAATWDAGWCWSIPQRGEMHHGYVYASSHLSDDAAAAELARRLPAAGGPRLVRFASGRRRHFVRGNVAALGNAYGFVEPLESTALHLVARQIGLLVRALPWRPDEADGRLALLNRTVGGWWDYLRWFLALHFRFNRRRDTPFWHACRAEADVSAWGELLEIYRRRGPLSADPTVAALFDAPDPLWGAAGVDLLLLAQGVPCALPAPAAGEAAYRAWRQTAGALAGRALPQRELLRRLDDEPGSRAAFVAPFLAAGPAFG
jgi:tryptophan 7-halogenase